MELTARQIESLHGALLAERAVLLRRIKQERTFPGSRDGDAMDISTFDRNADLRWETEEHETDRLLEISATLQRMNSGTYGICELCGEDIPFDRLTAVPFARLCVYCQGDEERQQASGGGLRGTSQVMPAEDAWGTGRLALRIV